jgi:hypothetical protein
MSMRGVMRLAGSHYATLMINYNDASILGRRRIDSSSLHPDKGSFFSPLYDILFIFCLFPFLCEHGKRITKRWMQYERIDDVSSSMEYTLCAMLVCASCSGSSTCAYIDEK